VNGKRNEALVSTSGSRALDKEASEQWGLNHFALVEAAGRACAQALSGVCKREFSCIVLAGKGNNAADALVMLRALILDGYAAPLDCSVFAMQEFAQSPEGAESPLSQAMLSVRKLGVPVRIWDAKEAAAALAGTDVVVDGIAGTGLIGPLHGVAMNMAETINAVSRDRDASPGGRPFIVSIDMPSGNFDGWQPGMPIVAAHATLAVEPRNLCLYTPSARPFAGTIIPVNGIFPISLIEKYREARLVGWEDIAAEIPPVHKTAHKYERGLVEVRAGSPGAAGAARLAALGAQAAGAGLVRLIVDPSLYPVIAPSCSGVMVVPDGVSAPGATAAAVLLGPGWGRGEDRMRLLQACLPLEEQGIPLILDADAIALAKDLVFHGNAILTPHTGEFAAYTGLPKDEILANPVPVLRRFAADKNVYILFKSHVLYVVSPDGKLGIIDGMNPLLAAGGSGDVLAGFCAAISARWGYAAAQTTAKHGNSNCPWWTCACAAASLLVRAAESGGIAGSFVDPGELSRAAASIAGSTWLEGNR
jgi:NAD(P)H-hydrate epimerase